MNAELTLPKYFLDRIEALNIAHKENPSIPLAVAIISSNDFNLAHFNASNYHFLEQVAKTNLLYIKIAHGQEDLLSALYEGSQLFRRDVHKIVLNGHGYIRWMQMGEAQLTPDFARKLLGAPLSKQLQFLFKSCLAARYFAQEWLKSVRDNPIAAQWTAQAPLPNISSSRTFFADDLMLAYNRTGGLETCLFTSTEAKRVSTNRSFPDLMAEKEAYLLKNALDPTANRQVGLVHHYLAEYYFESKNYPLATKYYELVISNQYWRNSEDDDERLKEDSYKLAECYSLLGNRDNSPASP